MFDLKVCYHLNGILYEYLAGHPDERMMIYETMLRFMLGEWRQFEPLIQRWETELSEKRRRLDRST